MVRIEFRSAFFVPARRDRRQENTKDATGRKAQNISHKISATSLEITRTIDGTILGCGPCSGGRCCGGVPVGHGGAVQKYEFTPLIVKVPPEPRDLAPEAGAATAAVHPLLLGRGPASGAGPYLAQTEKCYSESSIFRPIHGKFYQKVT